MQIYLKSMKNATSPLFRNHNRSALPAGTYITHRVIYYPLVISDMGANLLAYHRAEGILNTMMCLMDL